eukprot:gene2188-biopygen11255
MKENENQIGQAQQPQLVSIQLPPVKEFDPKGDPSTPNTDTKVIVESSPVGLGAILTQKQQDGQLKPVAYASRALSPTEQRYSRTEREGVAAFWSTQKFHYYLNKAYLKKCNESESNRHAVLQKEKTHNTDEEEDILAEELLTDKAQNVARPTRSERRPKRAIINANDANNTRYLNENNNSRLHESDNADMHQNSENRLNEGIVKDHWNEQNNEDIQEVIGNRTPVFVPDSLPTAIQEQVQMKEFPIRRSRKKRN